jgi:hypothetical protein
MKITSAENDSIGLFGYTSTGAIIQNVRIINPYIYIDNVSTRFVGSLIGYSNGSIVENNSVFNGYIKTGSHIGGLVGVAKSSSIKNSFFIGSIIPLNESSSKSGGLVGYTNSISDTNNKTIINECYSDSVITPGSILGGLVGENTGTIENSYSSGIIKGKSNIGSLVGSFSETKPESIIENSYSISTLSIDKNFLSDNLVWITGKSIEESIITSSFWNKDNTDENLTKSSIILDTESMKDEETYKSWDFENIWSMGSNINEGYPYLKNLPKITLKISGNFEVDDKTYDGTTDALIKSSNLTLSGIYVPTDGSINLNPIASFKDSSVGSGKVVDLKNSYLTGKHAFLYELDLTGSPVTNADIIYDSYYYEENYIETLNPGEYELLNSTTKAAVTGDDVEIPSISIPGFEEDKNNINTLSQGVVTSDEKLRLKKFYNRIRYNVVFRDFNGNPISDQLVPYEGSASLPSSPYRSGYRFIGWSGNYSNINSNEVITPLYRKKSRPKKEPTVQKIELPSVEGHWSEEAVEELVNKGIIVKYNNFNPENNITRVEFADYITRALGVFRENNDYEISFSDISEDEEYLDSIKSALEKGIIRGYEDGTFKPYQTITRQEAMVMYSRAIRKYNVEFDDFKSLSSYDDYYELADWSLIDVRRVITAGIFKGTEENKLSPSSTFKYAEAAESIKNLLDLESTEQ